MGSTLIRRAHAALLLVALLVGACVARSPVDDADPEGTLTTGVLEPGFLDPQQISGTNGVAVALKVFEPLLRLDPKTLRPMPGAASLPEVSADGLTYRLTIRDDSKFSDGTPVRARDYQYGVVRLCDPVLKAYYASAAFLIAGCADWNQLDPDKDPTEKHRAAKQKLTSAGIRATGEKQLTITLTEPASYFSSILTLWIFSPVRESDVVRGGEQWWTDPATLIGNGPFVLNAWRQGDRMIFTPNRYYRSPAKLKQWITLFITEAAVALNAYRHDEIDAFAFGQSLGLGSGPLQAILDDRALSDQIHRQTDACTYYLGFNQRRAPFDDPAVRLAFAKAIDREAYIREVLGGLGSPALSFIAPGLPGYDAGDDFQRFEPEAARRSLASSRYAGSAALSSISYPYNQVNVTVRARVAFLRDQWKKNLGVEVTLEPLEQSILSQRYRKTETIPQISFLGWCADYPDQQDWLTLLFHSKSTQGTILNTGFANSDFDRLVRQADVERDQSRRDALYQQASRMVGSEAVVAFMNNGQTIWLRKPWVRGVTDGPLGSNLHAGALAGGGLELIYIAKRGR